MDQYNSSHKNKPLYFSLNFQSHITFLRKKKGKRLFRNPENPTIRLRFDTLILLNGEIFRSIWNGPFSLHPALSIWNHSFEKVGFSPSGSNWAMAPFIKSSVISMDMFHVWTYSRLSSVVWLSAYSMLAFVPRTATGLLAAMQLAISTAAFSVRVD